MKKKKRKTWGEYIFKTFRDKILKYISRFMEITINFFEFSYS